ncbi:hypothetical protein LX15_001463 [Streptoalloteichus tenebrarius]|uniref:Uncharacterized protein n=1 Tax=Streptoalloteichus tenebrarius (strain ATCC 17920 / DSM 40477 / JCM 4838 / CBS 697.72 / NBRC 16177 / NCIMB 11028 / NRRL B-12390 / A12253. 1 / ISP 5477) TaxID=1933 RepID=A0ABT1HQI8_STRSD|nr:hypothetical protein [Streptoalloteichus tenebrarius]BFE99863.1 hypothetical protein GCM10020241_15390 [Streptoalloteichus tenebrarius]
MKLTRVSGTCRENDCPAVFESDRGTIVIQGDLVHQAEGLRLGVGEGAVEIPRALFWEATDVLGR